MVLKWKTKMTDLLIVTYMIFTLNCYTVVWKILFRCKKILRKIFVDCWHTHKNNLTTKRLNFLLQLLFFPVKLTTKWKVLQQLQLIYCLSQAWVLRSGKCFSWECPDGEIQQQTAADF